MINECVMIGVESKEEGKKFTKYNGTIVKEIKYEYDSKTNNYVRIFIFRY